MVANARPSHFLTALLLVLSFAITGLTCLAGYRAESVLFLHAYPTDRSESLFSNMTDVLTERFPGQEEGLWRDPRRPSLLPLDRWRCTVRYGFPLRCWGGFVDYTLFRSNVNLHKKIILFDRSSNLLLLDEVPEEMAYLRARIRVVPILPDFLPLAGNVALNFALLFGGVVSGRWIWGRMWMRPGCCRTCGYNLTGNTAGRCPECGAEAVVVKKGE